MHGGVAAIERITSPALRDPWRRLVGLDSNAVAEQTPTWLDALCTASGAVDASRLYDFADGKQFVLPLARRGRDERRRQHGFWSGWGMGGLVGAGLEPAHVSAVLTDLAASPALSTHIRPNPLQSAAWRDADTRSASSIARRAHVIDLGDGVDATWARFRKSGRRGVTQSERSALEVNVYTGGDMLDRYYEELFVASIERWAGRQREPLWLARLRAQRRDPIAKLQTFARALGDNFRLYLGTVHGELAAGNIVLWGPNAHATRGAMNYELAHEARASYALEWAAIRDACEAGHRWYQLGETGTNQSLANYKERFGAQSIEYAAYRLERLPLLAIDQTARSVVKRVIGFKD